MKTAWQSNISRWPQLIPDNYRHKIDVQYNDVIPKYNSYYNLYYYYNYRNLQ